jgi:hypothetical protein
VIAVVPLLPPQSSTGAGPALELVLLVTAALLMVVGLTARRVLRRATAVAWVGRREAFGPSVWLVPTRLRPPERISRPVSWGGDRRHIHALAECVLTRLHARPAPILVRGFADDVLSELPDDGFVLHESAVWAWLMDEAEAGLREPVG